MLLLWPFPLLWVWTVSVPCFLLWQTLTPPAPWVSPSSPSSRAWCRTGWSTGGATVRGWLLGQQDTHQELSQSHHDSKPVLVSISCMIVFISMAYNVCVHLSRLILSPLFNYLNILLLWYLLSLSPFSYSLFCLWCHCSYMEVCDQKLYLISIPPKLCQRVWPD